ncbi:carboxypeptidase-like regulatory domain-containing protein [Vagococcus hydrophili]|uniref:Carboxypeptidase regulatory-like domain-containing protein n=1 Tax=Vagococcus hydrophili TaxID=2714947 RepID=A0A6G8AT33_9ENTE|nr:carboxypeptidase-like regulatory domain-containing protein [Vagococcus hydrophili]QIL48238.1 carboxypeptidase regulatory-like domain-containing protein [Vagococcus hydrophili]
MNIKNSNIAVWDKSRKGIGNPNDIWQDVDWMMIRGFTNSGNPKAMSSNNDLANRFTINNYSRISNDIKLPIIIPDEEFQVGNTVVLKNNATSFYGSTDYYLPDGSLVGQAAPGAAVLFELAGRKYTTVTDSNGNWRFNNLDITSVSGGTYGQLSMIDQDKRISKIVPVLIEDKVPPTGDPRLIKAKKGDMTNLTDPKYAVLNSKDETTPTNQLIYEYVTSLEDRQKMVSEVGTYEVEVKLSDLAGNYTIIKAPVIVHEPPEVITDGFITGKDFEIDFDTWVSANDAGKRQLMISEEYGNLRGFEITGQNLIDITNIPSKLGINFSGHNWEPKKTYPITVKVKSYTKVIRVTLVPAEVEMNPNQVYSGTITPIYIDLTNNAKVDNSKIEKVKIGDDLETIVNQMITDKKMTLNYTGYGEVKVKDYKVIVNGNELKTSVVPDQNFQLVYNYTGQMKFASAPNLDFGKIETSQKQESYKLVSTSESDVSVINTLLNDNWNLQVSLPQGIKNKKTQEEFIGQLVYFDSAGKETVIDKYGKKIMEQKPEMMSLSKVDVRGSGKSGMTLKQEIGNSNGDYEGELIWSLEDSPKP